MPNSQTFNKITTVSAKIVDKSYIRVPVSPWADGFAG